MNNLKNKNILFLTHDFSSFQKSQIESVAKSFSKVYVMVRFKPISYLSYIFPTNILKHHRKTNQIDINELPDNIYIYTVPIFYLPTDRGYKKLGNKHYKKVLKIIYSENLNFDIIHAHYFWSSGYVGYRLKKYLKKPLVITGHGYDVYEIPFKNNSWSKRISKVLKYADVIFTNCKKNKSYISKLGDYNNIIINPIGVNDSLFFPEDKNNCRTKLNLPINKFLIICIAFFVPVKGHKYLIKSINEILKYRKDILCIFVGGGELKNDLKKRIRYYKLNNFIKLVDKIPHSSISQWINSSDIFVLPSLNEGMPDSMFEAMACGKPFIGTQVGGIPEVIDEKLGLLAQPGNYKDLSDKIICSIDKNWDPKYINHVSKNYTVNRNRDLTIKCYKNILGS